MASLNEYNNTYHHYVRKNPFNADYSVLTKKTETHSEGLQFKVKDRVRITKYKNIFTTDYTENWSNELFGIDSVLKTNPRTYKKYEREKNNRKL